MKIIDFHSHMLPGVDDGSPDAETSVRMLRAAREQGVDVQILTPHFYRWREDIDAFLRRREASRQRLEDSLPDGLPRILIGSETAFYAGMSREELEPLCVEGTRALLLEMPFDSWPNSVVDELATLSLDRGYDVVLAHIERFLQYHGNREQLARLAELPIHRQVNAEIFLRFTTRGMALRLVRDGTATLLGSDAHNMTTRRPDLAGARAVIGKRLGPDALQGLDETANTLLREAIEE